MSFSRKKFKYTLSPSVNNLIEQLLEKPSYIKVSPKKVTEYFDTSIEDAKNALAYIIQNHGYDPSEKNLTEQSGYSDPDKGKDKQHEDKYQEFLQNMGIEEDDVVQTYYKQKGDGDVRFTVQTRHGIIDSINEESLYEYLSTKSFDLPKSIKYRATNTLALLDITDAHIDKMDYVGQGGVEELNKNLRLLKRKFRDLLDDILESNPETIVFPVGSDFFNTNGSERATKNGTPQQLSVHWEDSFQAGVNFYRSCIDEMIKTCNVILVDIGGNHDNDKVFYLGQILKAVYESDDRIETYIGKDKRKYIFKNDILLGFEHGDIAKKKIKKLPNTMAIEQPTNWGKAKHRSWILGDIHHKETYTTLSTLEDQGVDIQFLRPATSSDRWHVDHQWIGAKKSITAIIYQNSAEKIKEVEIFF